MTERDHIVEQRILEYESRLKHVDEVIVEAHGHQTTGGENLETSQLLESIKHDREKLGEAIETLKTTSKTPEAKKPLSQVTPLDIWNTVADKLEKLAEHLDKKKQQ